MRRDLSLSLVAEAAIASFLSPDADERREAAMSRRLDRLGRQVARMERDLGISLETLALFIRYESVPSFVTMFRKTLGTAPGRYMAARQAG